MTRRARRRAARRAVTLAAYRAGAADAAEHAYGPEWGRPLDRRAQPHWDLGYEAGWCWYVTDVLNSDPLVERFTIEASQALHLRSDDLPLMPLVCRPAELHTGTIALTKPVHDDPPPHPRASNGVLYLPDWND